MCRPETFVLRTARRVLRDWSSRSSLLLNHGTKCRHHSVHSQRVSECTVCHSTLQHDSQRHIEISESRFKIFRFGKSASARMRRSFEGHNFTKVFEVISLTHFNSNCSSTQGCSAVLSNEVQILVKEFVASSRANCRTTLQHAQRSGMTGPHRPCISSTSLSLDFRPTPDSIPCSLFSTWFTMLIILLHVKGRVKLRFDEGTGLNR